MKFVSPAIPQTKVPAPVQAAGSGAQQAPALTKSNSTQINGHAIAPAIDRSQVYFDAPGDGSLWAMGAMYKAQFNADGASYLPRFGPTSPQNYPVSFQLQSVTVGGNAVGFTSGVSPTRTGSTIGFDHGSVLEQYRIDVGSMEQTFTFPSLPSGGDLVVRVGVGTELGESTAADGFRFGNDYGFVSYGNATVVDSTGQSFAATSSFEDGAILIRVPESFLATASFPVTIDPIVSTFAVDVSTNDDSSPDVAFDVSTGRYGVCWEDVFTATDHDVYLQEYDSSGNLISGSSATIDFTTSYWGSPRVANNNIANQFLVVAAVGTPSGAARTIMGRTRDAGSTSQGTQFTISTGASGTDQFYPDVGGDPVTTGPTYYMVCWESTFTSTDHDIYGRVVDTTGALLGTGPILVDFSTSDDNHPTVSKCDGQAPSTFANQRWTITWDRVFAAGDHDIYGAQYLWDGSLVNATYLIDFSGLDDQFPMASSLVDMGGTGERDYLVVYQRNNGTDNDIQGQVFNGTAAMASGNISTLEGGSFSGQHQIAPSVDSDGVCYGLSYSEQYSTSSTDYDQYLDTISRDGSTLQVNEHHKNVDFLTSHADHSQICSTHSGGDGGNRFMAVWESTYTSGTLGDIQAALYDGGTFAPFCFPGDFFDGASACPCGNNPTVGGAGCNNSSNTGGAILNGSGTPSLSADTVVFTTSGEKPTATSIVLQGASANFNGLSFGQGIRCVAGSLKRLYVKTASGGSITAPGGSDPHVHVRSAALGDPISAGASRYYMVYYRDPTVLGGCSASATFNTTQSGAYCWAP